MLLMRRMRGSTLWLKVLLHDIDKSFIYIYSFDERRGYRRTPGRCATTRPCRKIRVVATSRMFLVTPRAQQAAYSPRAATLLRSVGFQGPQGLLCSTGQFTPCLPPTTRSPFEALSLEKIPLDSSKGFRSVQGVFKASHLRGIPLELTWGIGPHPP